MVPILRYAIYLQIIVWVSEYENEICYVQIIQYYHILLINVMIDNFLQSGIPCQESLFVATPRTWGELKIDKQCQATTRRRVPARFIDQSKQGTI